MRAVGAWAGLLLAAAVGLIVTSCGTDAADRPVSTPKSVAPSSGSSVPVRPSPAPGSACAPRVPTSPGAAASLGLDVRGASAPAWSARIGFAEAAGGGRLFAAGGPRCVIAVQARSGTPMWSWAVPGSSTVMGLAAGPEIVLAATGEVHGHAPAMVYAATDGLVGLDPRTGAQRWSVPLADDGQGVPAVISRGRVIVAESDGTVLGLDAATGVQRWLDPAPSGCVAHDGPSGLAPLATMIANLSNVVVAYQCAGNARLVRVNPVDGAVQWTRTLPPGWSVEYQSPTGGSAGVIGLVVQATGAAIAPVTAAAPNRPAGYETDSVLALSAATGRPRWQLNGVPPSAGVYGGGGRLCVVSGFGVACYGADSGAQSWRWTPSVTPSHGGPGGPDFTAAATHAGRLYLAVVTAAAESIPVGSNTYRSSGSTFQLRVVDLRGGRTVGVTPLPAFYGGPQQVVVSADSPPGVLAVSGADVFLSPQLHETDVVEAFSLR